MAAQITEGRLCDAFEPGNREAWGPAKSRAESNPAREHDEIE